MRQQQQQEAQLSPRHRASEGMGLSAIRQYEMYRFETFAFEKFRDL